MIWPVNPSVPPTSLLKAYKMLTGMDRFLLIIGGDSVWLSLSFSVSVFSFYSISAYVSMSQSLYLYISQSLSLVTSLLITSLPLRTYRRDRQHRLLHRSTKSGQRDRLRDTQHKPSHCGSMGNSSMGRDERKEYHVESSRVVHCDVYRFPY